MMNNLANRQLTGLASQLIHDGLLNSDLVLDAVQKAHASDMPLVSYLVKNTILTSNDILDSVKKFNWPVVNLNECDPEIFKNPLLTPELIRQYHIIPLHKQNNILHVAISDPTDRQTLNAISFYSGLTVSPHLVAEDQLDKFIQNYFIDSLHHKNLQTSLLTELTLDDINHAIQENTINYDEPIIRFVDHLIDHALHQSASDIHIEPYEKICRIRYRQDGILYQTAEIPINLATRLATRLKVMAKLDISERRLPQDGRFQSHQMDIRINICPTLFGEKLVLRLLDTKHASLNIDELGFTDTQKNIFINKISEAQGLVLVTGPTGSGKTVTLYSALNYLNTLEKNISTVEDPVEIQLTGINQVHINPKINLNFSTVLRTFLRQDPDIIMVGEIRDPETAEIAIQAAQTGHLVLTTLHTNNSIETLTRLQSMGIAAYNIINSISLIIAQRLVRKLCHHCKQHDPFSHSFRSVGCQECLQGYDGRIGIYELLILSDSLKQLIMARSDNFIIVEQAKREGFISLQEIGMQLVSNGTTSVAEINRVLTK